MENFHIGLEGWKRKNVYWHYDYYPDGCGGDGGVQKRRNRPATEVASLVTYPSVDDNLRQPSSRWLNLSILTLQGHLLIIFPALRSQDSERGIKKEREFRKLQNSSEA